MDASAYLDARSHLGSGSHTYVDANADRYSDCASHVDASAYLDTRSHLDSDSHAHVDANADRHTMRRR